MAGCLLLLPPTTMAALGSAAVSPFPSESAPLSCYPTLTFPFPSYSCPYSVRAVRCVTNTDTAGTLVTVQREDLKDTTEQRQLGDAGRLGERLGSRRLVPRE